MATITQRKRADGSVSYTAQIRITKGGKTIHTESKTFSKRNAAQAWADKREAALKSDPEAMRRAKAGPVTVGDLFRRYRDERGQIAPLGRTKAEAMAQLEGMGIAGRNALDLDAADIVAHVVARRQSGIKASTANNDLVWLRVVFRYARTAWGIPVDVQAVEDAAHICRKERFTGRPDRRSRRPAGDELTRLDAHFRRRRGLPMHLVMWLAIYTARREAELCRMRLSDYDREHGVWLIRDVKHPEGSAGHHAEMVVPERARPIIEMLEATVKREDDRLLPYKPEAISAAWTRACHVLGIEDLRFHDLRHEACSRMAEDGMSIPEIQQVSLHQSWSSLQVYVNLRSRKAERVEFSPGLQT